jgi:hypothetical protein
MPQLPGENAQPLCKNSSTAEEHRDKAIGALCRALAQAAGWNPSLTGFEGRARRVYAEVATDLVDHIAAHAVETVRDLQSAESNFARRA